MDMKTLIDIQDNLMEELLKEANTRVKKKVVVLAIKTFIDVN
jgi:Arc/MetJ family transcription regulator